MPAANSPVTEAVASLVKSIALSSPSLTLRNPTRTHCRISWQVPLTRRRRHPPSPSFPKTSRRQNRTRHCKIRQRESGILAGPSASSHSCLLRCSAPSAILTSKFTPTYDRLLRMRCRRRCGMAPLGKLPSLVASAASAPVFTTHGTVRTLVRSQRDDDLLAGWKSGITRM